MTEQVTRERKSGEYSEMKEECIVCQRINPKIVFEMGHKIFSGDKRKLHELLVEAVRRINYADDKNRIFFCGRPHKTILAGLFYLLGHEFGAAVTMCHIRSSISINEASIRNSYRHWLETFPELFPHDYYEMICEAKKTYSKRQRGTS